LGDTELSVETEVLVDPGKHVLRITAPDRAERTIPVQVPEGTTTKVDVEPGTSTSSESRAPSGDGAPPSDTILGIPRRPAAIVLGAIGIVGMGIGTFLGFDAKSSYKAAEDKCDKDPSSGAPLHSSCTNGADGGESAHAQARLATFIFIGGTALLAG